MEQRRGRERVAFAWTANEGARIPCGRQALALLWHTALALLLVSSRASSWGGGERPSRHMGVEQLEPWREWVVGLLASAAPAPRGGVAVQQTVRATDSLATCARWVAVALEAVGRVW